MNWFIALSLANDERFLPAVHDVAEVAARQANFDSGEVARIARTVAGAAAGAMLASEGQGNMIDLRFESRAQRFEVSLKYVDARSSPPPAATPRGNMEAMEVSREGPFAVCSLVRTLP